MCGETLNHHMSMSGMNHAELRVAVMEYFRAELQKGKDRRNRVGHFTDAEKESSEAALGLLEQGNAVYWKTMGSEFAREELDRFFQASGFSREEYAECTPQVLDEIRRGRIGAIKAITGYGADLETYDLSEPLSAVQSAERPDVKAGRGRAVGRPQRPANSVSGPVLSVLFSERRDEAEKSGDWSPKLQDDYQSWTDLFIELIGDCPILEYRKQDARRFKDILMQLPSNRGKHAQSRGLSPLEAIEAAKTYDLDTLSASTVNKALGRMQSTWRWADKQLDEEVMDIFGPMKLAGKGNARTEADPFSKEQLQAIFSSPLFTGCKSTRFRTVAGDTDMSGTSWYWLPLLGLWTGARLNELCQLRVGDVDEEDGIPFLRFHEGDETQRIKGHKKRIVPLHPKLTALGFLRFVDAQRNAGHDRVFPALTVGPTGYYSDRPSKDFSAYLKRVGAKTLKTSFHSFRHNFKDACRHGGVNPDINDILLGHALPGMAGRYGAGDAPLVVLYEAVRKVEYPGLSLEHIRGHFPA